MYHFVIVALVAYSQVFTCSAAPVDDATKDTELVFALMIHRHGDRTTASLSETLLSNNPTALQDAADIYGYGQLTIAGRQRAYSLGQYMRERYGGLLSSTFNRSEISVRSTDYTRAKMSCLLSMAGLYPSVEPRWSEKVNWQPVPYTVVPVKYDFNQAAANCPVFGNQLYASFLSKPESMVPYQALLRNLSILLGFEETHYENQPISVYSLNDIFDSQLSLGIPLTPELQELKPQIAEVAGLGLQAIYGNSDYFALQAGPLIQDFLDSSAKVIAGEATQRVRIYSAHDLNVYAFEAALQLEPKQGVPFYAALLSLELRRNLKTGEHSVLPVYVGSPGEKPLYLRVNGCKDSLCNYDQFNKITSPYALDVDSWRNKCGWTNDLVIDDSAIV